ncbi:unnamed protein product [Merluccius merluccius]
MTSPSNMSMKDLDGFELEKTPDADAQADQSCGPAVQPLANGVRRLSTISERDLDPSPLGGSGGPGGEAWVRSSLSLCSDRRHRSSSSCLSSDDSYQPAAGGDDCAGLVLSCLHCRFGELAATLPEACGRALQRCFPSCTHAALSGGEADPPGRDWCSCTALDLDCSCCHSCQDTAELLELAMEISEVCYR